jgi:hypothetical protein
MPTYLGARSATGKQDLDNPLGRGFWTCAMTPAVLGWQVQSEIYHMAVTGPPGSSFHIYLDTTFYDAVARGDLNSWDPAQPMAITPGQTVFFYWNTGAGPAPRASVFGRQ